jgi:hypothetical protein
MEMPSMQAAHKVTLAHLKRTPQNLGTPHTTPRRVHIDVLPDVRAGSDPPSVDEAAEKGRRYRNQCRTGLLHRFCKGHVGTWRTKLTHISHGLSVQVGCSCA